MKVTDFIDKILAKKEGKKKQVNAAQLREVVRILNDELGGVVYRAIRQK